MDGVIKLLAVAGGALIGGLLVGLLTGAAVRGLTARKMAPWARNIMRLLGAVAGGWLVALWLLAGGGWEIGGPGGLGIGSGSGRGPSTQRHEARDTSPSTRSLAATGENARFEESLRIEVLGPAPLRKLAGGKEPNLQRPYRVEGQMMSLAEIKDLIRKRRLQEPPLRHVVLVLYNDSPARDRPVVYDLADWAGAVVAEGRDKLKVDYDLPGGDAPVP